MHSLMWAKVKTCFFGIMRSGQIAVEDLASDGKFTTTTVQTDTLKQSHFGKGQR